MAFAFVPPATTVPTPEPGPTTPGEGGCRLGTPDPGGGLGDGGGVSRPWLTPLMGSLRPGPGAEEEEGFGPWSPWTPCSKTCTHPEAPATKSRSRSCSRAGGCGGESVQQRACNLPHCAGGLWGDPPHCAGGLGGSLCPTAHAGDWGGGPSVPPPQGSGGCQARGCRCWWCQLRCPRSRPPLPGGVLCRPGLPVDAVGTVGRLLPQLRRGAAAPPARLQPPRAGGPLVPRHPQRQRPAPLLQPAGLPG